MKRLYKGSIWIEIWERIARHRPFRWKRDFQMRRITRKFLKFSELYAELRRREND